jgi:Domain of unknown function (DUF6134)
MMQRRTLLLGTIAGAAAPGRQAAAMGLLPAGAGLPIPPSDVLAFQVMRHDTPIGSHTLNFSVTDDTVTVRVAADVVVHFGPIPLVRYVHHNTEIWRGGRLASLQAHTNRNGTQMHMSAHRVAAGLLVEGSGASPYIAPEDALPTTYWNARMLLGPMIGTQDGALVHPKVTAKPVEPVRLASGKEARGRGYSLTGDLDLDLWYDADDRWMSMRFTVADGSVITYERL